MSAASAEPKPKAKGENVRKEIEKRLIALWQEDYVLPGWQTCWSDADACFLVMFQPCHQEMAEAMTESEFRMWTRGWDARRAAVMARRPRKEHINFKR